MSKHQSNRRKSYGRRQHEVAERRQRGYEPESVEGGLDDLGPATLADRLAFLDPRTPTLRYLLGD